MNKKRAEDMETKQEKSSRDSPTSKTISGERNYVSGRRTCLGGGHLNDSSVAAWRLTFAP